ncbi:unnamed protein product [Rotaria sp. Silwood1]|nr:unnamed protein product [Rotaria sp. Silwood1]CAF1579574.1 unnamed protein product [Rotaria sp. Silwood1]
MQNQTLDDVDDAKGVEIINETSGSNSTNDDVIIQKGKTPSLHLITIAILTLRRALESYTSLIEYNKNYGINSSTEDLSENEDELFEEKEEGNYL